MLGLQGPALTVDTACSSSLVGCAPGVVITDVIVKLPLSPSVFTSLTDILNCGWPSAGFSLAEKASRTPSMSFAHTYGSKSSAFTSRPAELSPRWYTSTKDCAALVGSSVPSPPEVNRTTPTPMIASRTTPAATTRILPLRRRR
ncbi:beta-ketoacyl synthase N-terminal-like domain-containing protein [Kibdelosporangium lantanae]|uniref:Beta-ketoacyl synthase N-terminal-like domain-containing protein n=1 Tax=Kibdelosporangium lantanae TaxID=1497396 RepID=A0ABW3MC75_9PSEU